ARRPAPLRPARTRAGGRAAGPRRRARAGRAAPGRARSGGGRPGPARRRRRVALRRRRPPRRAVRLPGLRRPRRSRAGSRAALPGAPPLVVRRSRAAGRAPARRRAPRRRRSVRGGARAGPARLRSRGRARGGEPAGRGGRGDPEARGAAWLALALGAWARGEVASWTDAVAARLDLAALAAPAALREVPAHAAATVLRAAGHPGEAAAAFDRAVEGAARLPAAARAVLLAEA